MHTIHTRVRTTPTHTPFHILLTGLNLVASLLVLTQTPSCLCVRYIPEDKIAIDFFHVLALLGDSTSLTINPRKK